MPLKKKYRIVNKRPIHRHHRAVPALLLLLLLWPAAGAMARGTGTDIDADLRALDKAVAERAAVAQQKEETIRKCKMALAGCVSYADMYRGAHKIFEEYLKYNSDSALTYADRCHAIAEKAGMADKMVEADVDKALVMIFKGDDLRADAMLEHIGDIADCPPGVRGRVALAYLEYYARRGARRHYDGHVTRADFSGAPWQRYVTYFAPGSWQRAYYTSIFTDNDLAAGLSRCLGQVSQPSVPAAMLYSALARAEKRRGNGQLHAHYLILSAINDVKSANHEAASLIYLLYMPQIDKSSQRAANYVKACTDNVRIYKDIGRSLAIVDIHSLIAASYEKKLEQRGKMMSVVIVLLLAAGAVIGITLTLIHKRGLRQAATMRELSAMNGRLGAMIADAKQMQQRLTDSNAMLKDEMRRRSRQFINSFWLVSQYISDVAAFKKSVFNLITAGKTDKARSMLASGSNIESMLGGFYRHFDAAFLTTHPDFIHRFNALLKPDCQVRLAAPDTMTPELRIYALVSIGITDSVSIAEFLHYSPQTIYNYRLKARRNALLPGKQFAEHVAAFYSDENDDDARHKQHRHDK